MTEIDNSHLIAPLIDETSDGDVFWYTELLDRRTNGSSRFKMLRFFEHRDRAHFLEQLPAIRTLCEQTGTRAYTRLSPRSRRQVAHEMAKQVLSQVLEGHYDALYHAYSSACGKTSIHARKLWLIDIDRPKPESDSFGGYIASRQDDIVAWLRARPEYVSTIPSRNGFHLIMRGFNVNEALTAHHDFGLHVSVHKDNPTNLFVPDSAA